MSTKCVTEEMRVLKNALEALSSIFPMPVGLRLVLCRGFQHLNQDEAYDILIYLINACYTKPMFRTMEQNDWKKRDAYSKMDIEKLKKDILEEVKNIFMSVNKNRGEETRGRGGGVMGGRGRGRSLKVESSNRSRAAPASSQSNSVSQRGKFNLIILKKSDLMVPSCPKFFKCCEGLARYAVNFQLSRFENALWPEKPVMHLAWFTGPLGTADEINMLIDEEKKRLEEEVHLFSAMKENLKSQIDALENELRDIEMLKVEVQGRLDNLIDNCSLPNKEDLRNSNLRKAAIAEVSKHVDKLSAENDERLKVIQALDERLSFLLKYSENQLEQTVIDGKELATHISYESKQFAEKENIKLFQNGDLNLNALLELAVKSYRSCSESNIALPQSLLMLLDIKLPSYEPVLKCELEKVESKLMEELTELKHKLVQNIDKCAMERWIEEFITPIPSIDFGLKDQIQRSGLLEPIVDVKRIEFLIHRKNKESSNTRDTNGSAMASFPNRSETRQFGVLRSSAATSSLQTVSDRSGPISSFNLKYLVTRSSSYSSLCSGDSPISTVKLESRRVRKCRQLRRSISSANLPLPSEAANESPCSIQGIHRHLSSTLATEDMFFEGDKSISPIYVGAHSGHPRLFEQVEKQCRSSIASTTSISLSNVSPPFSCTLNSSTSLNNTRNTFDSSRRSISFPDLSDTSFQEN